MHLKSPYPAVPQLPDTNFHNILFTPPPGVPASDYIIHIDGLTGRRRTKKEFYEEVRDGATALATPVANGGFGLSSEQGDLVGIYSPNSLDYMTLVHSCLVVGVPFCGISAYSTPYELAQAIKTATPSKLFVHPSLLSRANDAIGAVGLKPQDVYLLEGSAPGKVSFIDTIRRVREKKVPRVPVKKVIKDTLAYLVFSSGTSGLPKAVMVSHGNLIFMLASSAIFGQEEMKALKPPPPLPHHVWVAALPFHHSYGLHLFCLRGYAFPTTFVVLPRWDPDHVLRVIPKYQVTMLPLVPSVAHQLMQSGKLEKADLRSVTNVLCGAASLPSQLFKRLSAISGSPVAEGYGLSEATVAVCLKPGPGVIPGVEPIHGSCGVLLPGIEAKILREDGSHAEVNEPGEFWLHGGNMALGYYNNEKATKETFVDGWLRTGDHVRSDSNGTIYFVDRIKDTLKISGVQVSPTEIESVLRTHPAGYVSDVCVAGVAGGRTSDEKVPRAWVVLSDKGKRRGEHAVAAELGEWVKKNLSSYKSLRGGIESVKEIPKLPTGKVLRRVLQERYQAQQQAFEARPKL